jgi:DNA-binding HxlR family transcriptional regulator
MVMTLEGPLADRSRWRATHCSIGKAMAVVGSRSAMQILREAYYGTTRFHDFADRVGITDAVAAARLKSLVGEGILEKQPYQPPGQRTRFEYVLTAKGRDLLPAVLALQQWGDQYLQDDGGPIDVVDDAGTPVRVEVVGTERERLDLEDLRVRANPASRPAVPTD